MIRIVHYNTIIILLVTTVSCTTKNNNGSKTEKNTFDQASPSNDDPKHQTGNLFDHISYPTEQDQLRDQLTATCTPEGQPLQTKQFPMKRGVTLIKTLPDGTCIEGIDDDGDYVIYAVHGNKKIKFRYLNGREIATVLGQSSFAALMKAGMVLVKKQIEANKSAASITPKNDRDDTQIFVLFEAPINDCPKYRYRRGMASSPFEVTGLECIWDEHQITCPFITTASDSSHKLWRVFIQKNGYVFPKKDSDPLADRLFPNYVPKPHEWLGKQPACPKRSSVVNTHLRS